MKPVITLPHEEICILGRADVRPDSIAFDWTNSGILFRFRGKKVTIHFDTPDMGQRLFLHVIVDGRWSRACVCEGSTNIEAEALDEGEHKVHCVRITEVLDDVPLVMRAVTLEGENPTLLSRPILPDRRLEFVGDSITCGFGLLTNGTGAGYKTDEQDGAHTYAAQTAVHFMSQANFICISGRGVVRNCDNYPGPLLPELFMRTTSSNPTPWDHTQYQPDVAVVNAGTNDTVGENPADPEVFKRGVTDFIHTLRHVYPNAYILWVYGMMNGDMHEALQQAIGAIQDDRLKYVFMDTIYNHPEEIGACNHPNQRAHRRCAGVLIDAISDLTGWEK